MAEPAKSLETFVESLMPSVAKNLTPMHSEHPLIHIAGGNVPIFTPRIPQSLKSGEDQTVPRICVSTYLSECIKSARHTVREIYWHSGELPVYTFNERDFLAATRRVTKEPFTGEGWIVPHRLSNWEMKPELVARIRLIEFNGADTTTYNIRCVIRVNKAFQWDGSTTLEAGKDYIFKCTLNENNDDKCTTELVGVDDTGEEFRLAKQGYTVKY